MRWVREAKKRQFRGHYHQGQISNHERISQKLDRMGEVIHLHKHAKQAENKEIEKKKKKTSNPSPRGTRLPENWQPSEKLRQYAIKLGLDPDLTALKFRNYWTNVSGSRGVKLNWDKAFINWCLKAVEFGEGKNKKPENTPENVVPFPPNNPRKPSNMDWMIEEHNAKYGAN